MSASLLHHHFKAVTGLSPSQDHKQIRLEGLVARRTRAVAPNPRAINDLA
jgi:AraC-like DNA-binding protein